MKILLIITSIFMLFSCDMSPEFILYQLNFTQQFASQNYNLPPESFRGSDPDGIQWADGSENWSNFYYIIMFYDYVGDSYSYMEEVYPQISSRFMNNSNQVLFEKIIPHDNTRDFHVLILVWDYTDRLVAPTKSDPFDFFLFRAFWEPDDYDELYDIFISPAFFYKGDILNDWPEQSDNLRDLLGR